MKIPLPILKARGLFASRLLPRVTPERAFPEAEFELAVPPQSISTPELLSYNLAPSFQWMQSDTTSTWCGQTAVFDGVYYYPEQNLILDSRRRIVAPECHTAVRSEYLHLSPYLRREVIHLQGYSTSLRSMRQNFARVLIDHLPQLYLLTKNYQPEFGKVRLIYCPPLHPWEEFYLSRFLPSWLELFPVPEGAMYRCEKYLYASFVNPGGTGALPQPILDAIRSRFPSTSHKTPQRFYISRRLSKKGRRIRNEIQLAEALKSFGFESVVMEHLSIQDQINMFANATSIVAPHGAALANLVFAKSTTVLELFPGKVIYPHFYMLARACGLTYRHTHAQEQDLHSDFSADIDQILKAVQKNIADG